MTQIVIGIDPSLTSTGVVALDEQGSVVLAEAMRGEGTDVLRLWRLNERMRALLGRMVAAHDSVHAVLEGYGYSAQTQRLAELGEWVGLIKMALFDLDIPRVVVPPARLKRFTTGRGTAHKDEMRLEVYKRWGFEHPIHDVVDAYALAQVGRALLGWESRLTQAQHQVVAAIRGGEKVRA